MIAMKSSWLASVSMISGCRVPGGSGPKEVVAGVACMAMTRPAIEIARAASVSRTIASTPAVTAAPPTRAVRSPDSGSGEGEGEGALFGGELGMQLL